MHTYEFDNYVKKKTIIDFNETIPASPTKKFSAIQNFTILNTSQSPIKEEPSSPVKPRFNQVGQVIETKNKDYYVGGLRMNIIDIDNIADMNES
jgi:hypothetical protein